MPVDFAAPKVHCWSKDFVFWTVDTEGQTSGHCRAWRHLSLYFEEVVELVLTPLCTVAA